MRRFFLAVLILLALGVTGGGWYAYRRGFTRKWRTAVAEEFRKRDIELSLRKLTLNPFRGIIANEVKVFDARDRRRTLAVIDEMRLVINWANLIHGKTFLDALDLREATLALPIDPKDPAGPKLEIRRMSGRLFLPPEQVYLSSFEAEVYGVRVTASGRFINPQALTQSLSLQTGGGGGDSLAQVVRKISSVKYEGETPMLDLRFSGDLARPETVFVEARFWAEHATYDKWRLDGVYLDALLRDRRLALRQLQAADARGNLRVNGNYDFVAKTLELQLRSTLAPEPAMRAFLRLPQMDEIKFREAPDLALDVRAVFGDSPAIMVVGRVDTGRFEYREVKFDRLRGDLVWDGERWAIRNVLLKHATGEVTGDAMQLPGDFRTRLKSTINPGILAPIFRGPAADWLKQFEFLDSPRLSLEAQGSSPSPETLRGNAALTLGRTAYRKIWAQSGSATLRYGDRRLTVDPLRVARQEGSATGGLIFDFQRQEVRVQKMRTQLHPQEIIWWIDPSLRDDLAPYRFGSSPPKLLLDGLVHTKGGTTTQLRVDVDAPAGMDYTFLRRDLHASRVAARLDFTRDRLKIESLDAAMFGGQLSASASIVLRKGEGEHSADVRVEDMDFAALTKLYFDYDDSKGRLHGRYGFSIRGDDARSMRGRGELLVNDGKVFAFPFLGPLSYIVNGIVPGMGDDVARKGGATFTIQSGVLDTRDFLVESNGFSMIGQGKLLFLDDRMDFDVRINARGLPGVMLFPVSKLFEYTATDTLAKPNWRPKMVPRL